MQTTMFDLPPDDHSDDEHRLLFDRTVSPARKEELQSKIELRQNWGVTVCDDFVPCPRCRKKNSIRRRSDNMCMACIVRERNSKEKRPSFD